MITEERSKTRNRQEPRTPVQDGDRPLTMIEHLVELRRRILYIVSYFCAACIICYVLKEQLLSALTRPLLQLSGIENSPFIYTSLTEAFTTYLKLSLLSALALTIPMMLLQAWFFVGPALYKSERRMTMAILVSSPILFLIGSFFAYQWIIPRAWQFFLAFGQDSAYAGVPLKLQATISHYVSLTSQILFAFGLSFQLPLILIILGKMGLIHAKQLLRGRKYALLMIMIVSAILTPPDVMSMLGLTAPLYILYELSAQILRWMGKSAQS